MERTESSIIQVAPQYENEKIKEMEIFGWNLQGRQEIHQEGDAYGQPSFTGSTYIVKVKVSHYVKLHFVRSLSLPNLSEIRQIEAEYSNLAFPRIPSFIAPAIFTALGVFGVLGGLSSGLGFVIFGYLLWAGLGILWLVLRSKKRADVSALVQRNGMRAMELRNRVLALTAVQSPLEVDSAKHFACPSCGEAHEVDVARCKTCGASFAEAHSQSAEEALMRGDLDTAIHQLDASVCSRPGPNLEIVAYFNLFIAIWNRYKLSHYDGMSIPSDARLWALRAASCLDRSITSYHNNERNGVSEIARQTFKKAEDAVIGVVGITMIFDKAEEARLRAEAASGPLLCLSRPMQRARGQQA